MFSRFPPFCRRVQCENIYSSYPRTGLFLPSGPGKPAPGRPALRSKCFGTKSLVDQFTSCYHGREAVLGTSRLCSADQRSCAYRSAALCEHAIEFRPAWLRWWWQWVCLVRVFATASDAKSSSAASSFCGQQQSTASCGGSDACSGASRPNHSIWDKRWCALEYIERACRRWNSSLHGKS